MPESQANPVVSIILPTYNRAKFLPQAFDSIRSQTFTDWELIVVDDGSTDNTPELVQELTRGWPQPVRFHRQPNGGPYAARNAGLNRVSGEFVAFFDSDDIWLPHHLRDCTEALTRNPDVDWVYGACRILDLGSGRELEASTFYPGGRPRTFLRLRTRVSGPLRVIDDPGATQCMILNGLYSGLQNSVIRRRVFDGYRFATHLRNEAEDQVVVIRSLVHGHRIGYLDNIHVLYHVHAENSSNAATGAPIEKRLSVARALVRGFEEMGTELPLQRRERKALDRRLGQEYFWILGYALLWSSGRRREALDAFRRGLRYWPWDVGRWKTYLLAQARVALRPRPEPDRTGQTERVA